MTLTIKQTARGVFLVDANGNTIEANWNNWKDRSTAGTMINRALMKQTEV